MGVWLSALIRLQLHRFDGICVLLRKVEQNSGTEKDNAASCSLVTAMIQLPVVLRSCNDDRSSPYQPIISLQVDVSTQPSVCRLGCRGISKGRAAFDFRIGYRQRASFVQRLGLQTGVVPTSSIIAPSHSDALT